MTLWTMIFRKMAKNKWLQLNLWFGLTICVALFSSMPLYSEAIMHRTLQKELQLIQEKSGVVPGYIRVATTISSSEDHEKTAAAIAKADTFINTIPNKMGLDVLSFYQQRTTQKMKIYGADATELEIQSQKTAGNFISLSDMEKRVRLVEGRMPVDRTDGVFEALVVQKFLFAVKRGLGEELIVESAEQDKTKYRVIPVGIIETNVEGDSYLPYLTTESSDSLLIPFEQFEREFVNKGKARITELDWRYALNYEQLSVDKIEQFVAASTEIKRYFRGRLGMEEVNIPATETIASYQGKQEKLDILMLSLYSPVMLMLAFYLFMVANLIIERQKTEISVLRSRGASRLQIMLVYICESLILGLAALGIGPFLGVAFTKVLGASNGFLEFVQRTSLSISMSSDAYKIAAVAVGGAILLILVPAFLATRASIVNLKQLSARMDKTPIWHKIGIDFILIGVSVYLLYNFNRRQEDLKRLALDSDALQLEPLLFFIPALFALGGGLLLLRLYPYLIRFIFWAGRKWWSPALYSSLIQISRSSGQYLTIKVFLIITVATGLFSANAARTINDNMDSKIQYNIGADIVLTTRWPSNMSSSGQLSALQQQKEIDYTENSRVQYTEPAFQPFKELQGVQATAKVFKKSDVRYIVPGGKSGKTELMGIHTLEFGETAWMKNRLLDYHINHYLNLMATNPQSVLISQSLAEDAQLKAGDNIRITWDGLEEAQFVVYGVVDYWPSWNPLPKQNNEKNGEPVKPHLIVGHLSTIQNRLAIEPYEVWLKLKEGVTSQSIYEQLSEKNLKVASLQDARQQLITSKNDPFRLAINGVMTLGFVISMMISFFGFLLFWVLTLSGRTLQYGVFRAMGLPFSHIIGMLVCEQLLTSVAAVLIGMMIGNLTSELFVPLFEISFATSEQVPPFEIVYELGDYMQVFSIVGVMLMIGLMIISYRLSRTRIASALKLGEE